MLTQEKEMSRYNLKPLVICLSVIWLSPSLWADTDDNKESATTLSEIIVDGSKISRDEIGYSRVYARDISNLYKGKQEIETYRGNSVSDLFSGMVGVYSGDSRNSGALDPNIRGIQGEGKIPVTIDGTEQAITVWRGYSGSNNRNYVDPNLISSIYVEKGPSMTRGVKSGIGGSVALKTLEIDDIVKPGEKFGLEIKLEGGNNAIKRQPNPYEKSVDYRTVASPSDITGGMWRLYFGSGSDRQAQRFGGQGQYEDKAIRIATGVKQDKFDALLVYAYRDKGNYFSGKRGAEKYGQLTQQCQEELIQRGGTTDSAVVCMTSARSRVNNPFVSYLARLYFPGGEVTNTSLHTESWLGKFNYHFGTNHKLGLGVRLTDTQFGEIMPSRIGISQETVATVLQWPEAWVKQKAFNLDYQFNPKDNPWIDFTASLWTTRTDSKTNSAGGAPGDVLYLDNTMTLDEQKLQDADMLWQVYAPMLGIDVNDNKARCRMGIPTKQGCENKDGRFNTIDGAAYYATNNRLGFNFSNKFRLHPKLELMVSADWQHENLKAHNNFDEFMRDPLAKTEPASPPFFIPPVSTNTNLDNIAMPRNGKRHEYRANFHFTYRPFNWLTLTAGAEYSTYQVRDNNIVNYINGTDKDEFEIDAGKRLTLRYRKLENNRIRVEKTEYVYWDRDEYGRYTLDNYPLSEQDEAGFYEYLGQQSSDPAHYYRMVSIEELDVGSRTHHRKKVSREELLAKAARKRGHGWVPKLGLSIQLNDYGRLYARYTEHLRWPSIFEATSGFGSYLNQYQPNLDRAYYDFLPEHAKNWEVGYVHDFTKLIPKARYADARINYYYNTTKNVMDRDENFVLTQYDRRIQSGVELQARFDFGRVFGDISVVRILKTQMCDKAAAKLKQVAGFNRRKADECWNGGFSNSGYLAFMIQPRWSVTANLGSRWLNNRLELGTRFTYHSRIKDSYFHSEQNFSGQVDTLSYDSWQPVFVVDAYARYQLNKYLTLEMSGNNLGDRYYQDPLTRTMMPAPGRTLRLSVKGVF